MGVLSSHNGGVFYRFLPEVLFKRICQVLCIYAYIYICGLSMGVLTNHSGGWGWGIGTG